MRYCYIESKGKLNDLFSLHTASSNNRLYIGQTSNLRVRLKHHAEKLGAKFIKDNYDRFKLVYEEGFRTRLEAMRREKQLKGWTRSKKEALISGDLEKLKKL